MFDPYETPQLNGNFRHFQVAKEEANYKLCRVKVMRGPRGIPYAVTHDGRTVRYPDPDVKAHETVRRGAVKSPISYGFMGI
jgi:small subunit ribosomal protein S4e